MLQIRVKVNNQFQDLDLFTDEEIRMDLSIAEVQDITKKNSSFSRDFTIPGSKNNNQIFLNFYNPSSSQYDYDPRNKFEAQMLYDGYIIFEGYLRLNQGVNTGGEIFYNVNFYTQVGDLVANISDKYMRDLDLSYLDIPSLNIETELSYWKDPDLYNLPTNKDLTFWQLANKGYSYQSTTGGTEITEANYRATPLIEFTDWINPISTGSTDPSMTNPFNGIKWWYFIPNIQVRELYEQVFLQNGYILNSEFMDTAYFKRYHIPLAFSNTLFPLQAITPNYIVQQSGLLDATSYTPLFCSNEQCSSVSTGGGFHRYINPNPVLVDNINATTGNLYSILLSTPGFYEFKVTFTATNTGSTDNTFIFYNFRLEDNALSLSGWSMAGFSQVVPTGTTAQTYTNYYSFDSTQEARSLTNYYVFDIASTLAWSSSNYIEDIRIELIPSPLTPRYLDGPFKYNNEFPTDDIKQIDFIQSVNKAFNLVVVPDPDKGKTLNVEPIIDYYNSGPVLDWTSKVDRSKQFQVFPTTVLIDGTIFYNYSVEKDLGHETFSKTNKREFGTQYVSTQTDYKDKITEIKPIFSSQIDYVIPINTDDITITSPVYYLTIQKDIEGTSTNFFNPYTKQLQLLYRGIVLPTPNFGEYQCPEPFTNCGDFQLITSWWFQPNTGSTVFQATKQKWNWMENNRFTTYPWALSGFSHYTNFNKRDRYDLLEQDFTCYEDMYDIYYKDFIDDLTSEDSRMVSCWVYLTPSEVKAINFSEKIFIDGNYYRINKIKGYSLTKPDVVQVELIKITREYRPHRVRYFDLINCTSGGTDLHTSTDLNATIFAYDGKYIKLTDGNCYLIQRGSYNSSYTYQKVTASLEVDPRAQTVPVWDTCELCQSPPLGIAPNPWEGPLLNFYDEIDCNPPLPIPSPTPTPTPSASPEPGITPSPTRTPTPTPSFVCECNEYEIENFNDVSETVNYTDCDGSPISAIIAPDSFIVDCLCEGTLVVPSGVSGRYLGPCIEVSQTPVASPSQTPTKTPTPTPTASLCECYSYSITNIDTEAGGSYQAVLCGDCEVAPTTYEIGSDQSVNICACNGTVTTLDLNVIITKGGCCT